MVVQVPAPLATIQMSNALNYLNEASVLEIMARGKNGEQRCPGPQGVSLWLPPPPVGSRSLQSTVRRQQVEGGSPKDTAGEGSLGLTS